MAFLVLILLGVVQGLCEFLPVSSSGHLVLLSTLFGIEDSLFVSIILHVATLLAVLIAFRKDLWRMIKHPLSNEVIFLAISTISTCLIAIVLMPLLKNSFEGIILPVTFALSGIILFATEKLSKNKQGKPISYKQSLIIGLAQGLALLPGLSRSGTTISAGIMAGGDKKECAKFSFLLSIPTILGSLLLEIVDLAKEGVKIDVNIAGLVCGCLIAFIIALASIKFMMRITEKTNFKWFALYLGLMAIVSLIIFW
ncbi:MAG: undecaprenyl-diphosphate phosphatase [Clostridia bacterium]|nr:undecaprenyl-diphosphate phosphatase [Clostridia bacterium]